MPVDFPICKCPVSTPAVRPYLIESGKGCRAYFCKSCRMRLVAASQSSGIIRYPCFRQLFSSSSSYRNATECVDYAAAAQSRRQSDNAKIPKARQNHDYFPKKALQFCKKTGKKPIPQSGSDANNDSITISSLLPCAGSSREDASSAGMALAIAAWHRQRQLRQDRSLQEQRSNQEWENKGIEHRLLAPQELHDAQEYQALSRDRAYAAQREANRRFFQFPQPSELPSVTTAEERANNERVQDLYARSVAMGEGRENPEVMMESARYSASPVGSSYRRNIDRRVPKYSHRYDEEQRRAQQERERRDRYRQRNSGRRRHRDLRQRCDCDGNDQNDAD